MDFRAELSKWGYNKGNAIDVEILIDEILPSLFFQKEEPKQEHNKYLSCCRSKEECNCGKNRKQETLKEVSKNYTKNEIGLGFYPDIEIAFEKGAKWQQEQEKNKFSEEDMIAFGNKMQLVSDVDFDGNIKFSFDPSQAIKRFKKK